jgi:uncharacterized protein YneR
MRFMLDGEAVDFNQTPSDLDLEDNDQIDCFLQQVGGASDDEAGGGEAKSEDAPITIRVKDQTGEETMFKIKKSTKMKKVSLSNENTDAYTMKEKDMYDQKTKSPQHIYSP